MMRTGTDDDLVGAAGRRWPASTPPRCARTSRHLGTYGTPGTGYDVEYLLGQIDRELGLDRDWPVVVVGMGNLGRALARSQGFSSHGFRVAALFDSDPGKLGETVAGCTVRHLDDLEAVAATQRLAIGVITTPATSAPGRRRPAGGSRHRRDPQLRALGPHVPAHVMLRHVDLSIELQVLTFYQSHPDGAAREGELDYVSG